MPGNFHVLYLLAFISGACSWPRTMPGGAKIEIGGKFYAFDTNLCSGGIFFRKPVYANRLCLHGYFLRRINGCRARRADIVGGENYACIRGESTKYPIQALISITNSHAPLEHTLTMYDDQDWLTNFRRYTYIQGLEGQYQAGDVTFAKTLLVANMKETPDVALGDLCYRGKPHEGGGSYMVNMAINDTSNLFGLACPEQSQGLPWERSRRFPFNQGFTAPSKFANEIEPFFQNYQTSNSSRENLRQYEIWGGQAYCLHADIEHTKNGLERMRGLQPSLEQLETHCTDSATKNDISKSQIRRDTTHDEFLGRDKRKTEEEVVQGIQKISTFQTTNRGRTIIIVVNETCPPYCIQDGSCCDGGKPDPPPPPPLTKSPGNGQLHGEECPPFCVNVYDKPLDGAAKADGPPKEVDGPPKEADSPPKEAKDLGPVKADDDHQPRPDPILPGGGGRVAAGILPVGFQRANLMNCIRVCLPQPLPVRVVPMTWTF